MINFLSPIGIDGLLVHNMTLVLSCFAARKLRLLNLMDMFLNEPSLDWVQASEKLYTGVAVDDGDDAISMFAGKRMQIVKGKLSLRNPVYSTLDELDESVMRRNKPQVLKAFKNIARGDEKHNIRARVGEYCADIPEQVECLLDQATDANIVSRAWGGYMAFL